MENIVIKSAFAAAIMLIGVQAAAAQSSDTLPLVRNCTVVAPAQKGQSRLVLVDSRTGENVVTYLQINGPTKLSGPLDAVTISVAPFDATVTVKGDVPKTNANYVRAVIAEGWASLLERIRKGEQLTLSAGDETITIPLAGSGTAVAALQKCAK
jgi:hypothetical protein